MNNRLRIIVAALLLFVGALSQAQQPVVRGEKTLSMPWCGGLNACQFGRLDLNNDGKKDLVAFDRHGNRLLCFLNRGETGEIRYEWSEKYARCFPKIDDWCIFADYDGDGREDLFTYSKGWAGIKVYRNISTDTLAFQLVKSPYLTSFQGGGEVNLLATDADYPAIVDLDGDGDLDILTFWALGTFIEKHVNMSVERFGTRDSLVYVRTEQCWGRVAENEENNLMYLDTCLFGKGLIISENDTRHRGATFAVRDLTGDGLVDLLLADVDYPGLTFLKNGGDANNAVMTSQTSDFPASNPVSLFSMPVPFFTDIDNNGIDDLLVSPFDPNPMASEGIRSVWLYLNRGTHQYPDFHLYTKSFLQDEMIDVGTGTFPVFADVDHDGLTDLIIGNIGNVDAVSYHYGSLQTHRSSALQFYKNVGTADGPVFQIADTDLGHLQSRGFMGLAPTFGDLNRDRIDEIIMGTASGALLYLDSGFNILNDNYLEFDGKWSAPCLFDVDADGVTDLVVGNQTGRLSYFQGALNHGNVVFEKITDFWGEVDVRDYDVSYHGYSVPFLFHAADELLLLVGSESGKVFLFDSIGNNLNGAFRDNTKRLTEFVEDFPESFGWRSVPTMADLNADGRWDFVVGNFCGGLQLFNVYIVVNHSVAEIEGDGISVFPNPTNGLVCIKGVSVTEVQVYNALGQLVKTVRSSSEVSMDGLPQGIYTLRIMGENGSLVNKRIVVE